MFYAMDSGCILVFLTLMLLSVISSALVKNERSSCLNNGWIKNKMEFTYRGSLRHELSDEHTSNIYIYCTVIVTELSGTCQYHLQLQNCDLNDGLEDHRRHEHGHMVATIHHLNRYAVIFTFGETGMISNILAHTAESYSSLNIKRGILSLLQKEPNSHMNNKGRVISMPSVHGVCNSIYSNIFLNGFTLDTDLNSCFGFSFYQVLPMLRIPDLGGDNKLEKLIPMINNRKCTINLDSVKLLKDITCEESYGSILGPQHVDHKIISSQELSRNSVQSVSPIAISGHLLQEVSLTFDLGEDNLKPSRVERHHTGSFEDLINKFVEFKENFKSWKSSKILKVWSGISESLKNSGKNVVIQFTQHVFSCPAPWCSSRDKDAVIIHLQNIMVSCGSQFCLEVAVNMTTNENGSESGLHGMFALPNAALWFKLMTVHGLTENMINKLVNFCIRNPLKMCVVPLSVMLKQFSVESHGVKQYIQLLKNLLANVCLPNIQKQTVHRDTEELAIISLKAIKNLQDIALAFDTHVESSESLSFTVKNCIINNVGNVQITKPAIKILQQPGYWQDSKSLLLSLLHGKTVPSPTAFLTNLMPTEIRVAAFHAVVASDDITMLTDLIELYKNETSKQMKAFLISYFKNIADENGRNVNLNSLQRHLKEHILLRDFTVPLQYINSQATSWYSYISSEEQNSNSNNVWVDSNSLFNPGSVVPNSLDVNMNLEANGLKFDLADINIKNDGFDFTSELYSDKEDQDKNNVNNLQNVITRSLQELHHQITSTLIYPYLQFDFSFFGTELGHLKLQDFYLWNTFSHAKDFQSIWEMLKLDNVMSKLYHGVDYEMNNILTVPLYKVIQPIGIGLPVEYTIDGTVLAMLSFNGKVVSNRPAASFSELIGKKIKGEVIMRTAFELSHKFSVYLNGRTTQTPTTMSSVDETWYNDIDQSVSITSTDSKIYLQFPVKSWPSFHHRINGKIAERGEQTEIDLRQSNTCLLRLLEVISGFKLCNQRPELEIWKNIGTVVTQFSHYIWSTVPSQLEELLNTFITKNIAFERNALVVNIKFPTSLNDNLKPQHWLTMLNDIWMNIRNTTIPVPKKYFASVFKSGYISTFDGRLYKFPGYTSNKCTYILAHDYRNYKFVIFKSSEMVIVSLQDITVSIYNNGKILVNNTGNFSDPPVLSWNKQVSVTREGGMLHLSATYGVQVMCNLIQGYCTFVLDGWYHNTTHGLLGTNDNEQSNDFKLESGAITSNINTFVSRYEAEGIQSCRLSPTPAFNNQNDRRCQDINYLQCRQLFQYISSPLASCFPAVDPSQFLAACIDDMSYCPANKISKNRNMIICETANVYTLLCQQKNIQVNPLSECVTCKKHANESQNFAVGQTWNEPLNNRVDVVFIISMHHSMEVVNSDRNAGRTVKFVDYFQRIVNDLRKVMKQRGIEDINIGLVGYDGEGQFKKHHSYSFNGELFTRINQTADITQKAALLEMTGLERTTNSTQVLMHALHYPYRSNAVKLVMWVTDFKTIQDPFNEQIKMLYAAYNLKLQILSTQTYGDPRLRKDRNSEEWSIDSRQSDNLYNIDISATSNHQTIKNIVTDIRNKITTTYMNECQECKCYVKDYTMITETMCSKIPCDRER